jgi:hypothetical protein
MVGRGTYQFTPGLSLRVCVFLFGDFATQANDAQNSESYSQFQNEKLPLRGLTDLDWDDAV